MDNENLSNLGAAELAALERFRKRKIKLDGGEGAAAPAFPSANPIKIGNPIPPSPAKVGSATPASPTKLGADIPRNLTDRESKTASVKKQMVSLLAAEIQKLFRTGLDDGKLITLDIESDSGKVISPDNLSEEKLEQMSLSELSKIRFRVDVLNQIIDAARKMSSHKDNTQKILELAGVKTAKNYNIVEQASDDQEFLELFCYVLSQETSTNLMSLYYACKNYAKAHP